MPEEALPETLLVVLDQNMFNTNWRQSSPTAPQDYGELEMDFFDTLLRTGLDYGNRKFSIAKTILPQQGVYGLAAAARGMGFAVDGSYRYGKTAEKNLDQPEKNFADTYRNIDFGELRFAYGEAPDALALSQLDACWPFARKRRSGWWGFCRRSPPRSTDAWSRTGDTAIWTLSMKKSPGALRDMDGNFTISQRWTARTTNTWTAFTAGTVSTRKSR